MQLHLKRPARNIPYQTLKNMAKGAGASGQWVPYALRSTRLYPQAGTVADLVFFDAVSQDKTLDNIAAANKIESGTIFVPEKMFISYLRPASVTAANTAAGLLDDISRILNVARGTVQLTVNGKPHDLGSMRLFGQSGTATGVIGATLTAPANVQQGGGPDTGGYPLDGDFVLSDEVPFGVALKFAPVLAPISADTQLCVELFGQLLKPVA